MHIYNICYVLQGSIAYAKALSRANLLTEDECNTIIEGLEVVRNEWAQEIFETQPRDEDIHTANERRLKVSSGNSEPCLCVYFFCCLPTLVILFNFIHF